MEKKRTCLHSTENRKSESDKKQGTKSKTEERCKESQSSTLGLQEKEGGQPDQKTPKGEEDPIEEEEVPTKRRSIVKNLFKRGDSSQIQKFKQTTSEEFAKAELEIRDYMNDYKLGNTRLCMGVIYAFKQDD